MSNEGCWAGEGPCGASLRRMGEAGGLRAFTAAFQPQGSLEDPVVGSASSGDSPLVQTLT